MSLHTVLVLKVRNVLSSSDFIKKNTSLIKIYGIQ